MIDLSNSSELISRVYCMDCLEFMSQVPDKFFELCICDPPYGINITKDLTKDNRGNKLFMSCSKDIRQGVHWDFNIPSESYFIELFRVSKNQIIWGGNYFIQCLKNTRCLLIWDKMNGTNDMADAEIAWTSFDSSVRMFRMHHFSAGYGDKIHPTQKPVALYKWLLKNYAKPGDKIFDSHGGSFSSRIAAYHLGFDFWGTELDP